MKIFEVGGAVRDRILGHKSKDHDFAVECESFQHMYDYVKKIGHIYVSEPKYLTIRAKVNGIDSDYVLCRKDGTYATDGRRPDYVEVGTIDDDLARRDFTVNAIAIAEDGTYYDPHDGIKDINYKLIRCVGVAADRFREDSLRILRALRFSITKQFTLDSEIKKCLENVELVNLLANVSVERIRDELHKAFKYDTLATLYLLASYPYVQHQIFHQKNLWLEPTLKGVKR